VDRVTDHNDTTKENHTMHSEGLAFMILLEMQKKRGDRAAHHRAELSAARRARRRSAGRLRRQAPGGGGYS
jgi:hypothetical protein